MRKNLLAFSFLAASVSAFAQSPSGGGCYLSFDGVDDHVDIGQSAGIGIRTIEFAFSPFVTYDNTTMTGDAVALVYRNSANDQDEFGFYFVSIAMSSADAGKIAFTRYVGGTPITIYSDANSWQAGSWYHIAAVMDGTTGMTMYVNGALQTSTHGSVSATTSSNDPTEFGRWGNANMRYFNGAIDEARFWNAARTAMQIQGNMCSVNPSSETTLAGYWPLNTCSGNAIDATGNGYHGMVNGATWIVGDPCLTVGMNEPAKSDVKIFPNPANEMLQLNGLAAGSTLSIFDATGKMIAETLVENSSMALNVQQWTEGLYLYRVRRADGRGESVGKFCVQR